MAAVGSASWIHLDATTEAEWTTIPAENLVSVCDGTPSQVAVTALSAQQVPGLAFALQLGVGALVLAPPDEEDDVRRVMLWQAGAIARAQRTEIDETRALARSSALAAELAAELAADEIAVAEDAPALTMHSPDIMGHRDHRSDEDARSTIHASCKPIKGDDITTAAPPLGTCSGDAACVQATVLPKKVQGWAKETRSLALCERWLPQKLLES